MHCLRRDLAKDKSLYTLRDEYQEHKDDPVYQSVLNTIIRSNMTNSKGEKNKISSLILKLISDNQDDEIPQMASDPEYCDLFLKQYNL